jgi:hypothetical protein
MIKLHWVVLLGALSAVSAFSSPVTWTLGGVTFDDGGTASGSFVYDANTGLYSSINITTTTGTTRTGVTYHFGSTSVAGPTFNLNLTVGSGDLTGTPALFLVFTNPLTNAGGTDSLVVGSAPSLESSESACSDTVCFGPSAPSRQVTAGSVVGVAVITPTPAPPTWSLSLIGLLIIGSTMFMMRRSGASA